jgi:DNA-binding response OmpR family regulator
MSRILIVDDVDAAEDLAMLLGALGHETETVFDGWQAIEVFKDFDPDVVFLDLELGFFDGFDAARAIRGESNGRQPVLVAISATRGVEIEVATRAVGFDLFLKKPFDPHAIIAMANEFAQRPAAA